MTAIASLEGIMTLRLLRGIGDIKARRLAQRHGTWTLDQLRAAAQSGRLAGDLAPARLADDGNWQNALAALGDARQQLLDCGARAVWFSEEGFPEGLRAEGGPALAFLSGPEPLPNQLAATVGTREPDAPTERLAGEVGRALARNGWAIVNGLSRGVDTLFARKVLEAGSRVVGVLDRGIDQRAPGHWPPNRQNLTLVSGFLPGTRGSVPNSVVATKHQAMLARCVVTVQLEMTPGTLHTVTNTLEAGKVVFFPAGSNLPGKVPARWRQAVQAYGAAEDLLEQLAPLAAP